MGRLKLRHFNFDIVRLQELRRSVYQNNVLNVATTKRQNDILTSKHNRVVPIDELSFRSVVIRSRIERIKTFDRTQRISPDRRGRIESVRRTSLPDVVVGHEAVRRVVGRTHREPEVSRRRGRRRRHVRVRRSQRQRSERSAGLDVRTRSGHKIPPEIKLLRILKLVWKITICRILILFLNKCFKECSYYIILCYKNVKFSVQKNP